VSNVYEPVQVKTIITIIKTTSEVGDGDGSCCAGQLADDTDGLAGWAAT